MILVNLACSFSVRFVSISDSFFPHGIFVFPISVIHSFYFQFAVRARVFFFFCGAMIACVVVVAAGIFTFIFYLLTTISAVGFGTCAAVRLCTYYCRFPLLCSTISEYLRCCTFYGLLLFVPENFFRSHVFGSCVWVFFLLRAGAG